MQALTATIKRRTDIYLLPFLSLLFLLNSLDRSNVGNAETAGFTRHAGLAPEDLNDAVSAFFLAFVLLQPVGAALGKKVGVGRWVGGVMVGWGILTGLNAFVQSRAQLIGLRICIGALEAGFYPATVFYISLFYTRYEFAQRLGMFYGQYAVAGAFGGLVSYFVFRLFPNDPETDIATPPVRDPDHEGWYSYQILFLLEAALTIIVAFTAFVWLPTGPKTAWWLKTPAERAWAEKRVLIDRATAETASSEAEAEEADDDDEEGEELLAENESDSEEAKRSRRRRRRRSASRDSKVTIGGEPGLTRQDVIDAIKDWRVWWLLACNITSSVPGIAFSVFLPLVVQGFGYSTLHANLLTIPPFMSGACALWYTTYLSDRSRLRLKYILYGLSLSLLSLALLLLLPGSALTLRYLSLCLLLSGSYIASPLTVAWLSGNMETPGKRAVVLGINGWGNVAGVLASWIFRPEWAPGYERSFGWTMGSVGVAWVGYALFWAAIRGGNVRRGRLGVGLVGE
ncbi:MFS general substrate transporter [Choiromyces venosus 120613-1]|uniref:MFS general substrate transporter n=1 Tax=Choiromyces venosus 120613-1 TaxID=1336337 RepID=A0A3N4IYF4_9PEZI|nr:MFS general substrate transporter [Choiromyces venosus 120613-1]